MSLECPTCKARVATVDDNPAFPFCSARCKLVDLGNWLGGVYRTPGEPAYPEEPSDEPDPRGSTEPPHLN